MLSGYTQKLRLIVVNKSNSCHSLPSPNVGRSDLLRAISTRGVLLRPGWLFVPILGRRSWLTGDIPAQSLTFRTPTAYNQTHYCHCSFCRSPSKYSECKRVICGTLLLRCVDRAGDGRQCVFSSLYRGWPTRNWATETKMCQPRFARTSDEICGITYILPTNSWKSLRWLDLKKIILIFIDLKHSA